MAKTRKHKIDFTGVESYNKPAEGSHKAKITKVEETTSQGGNDMFVVSFEVIAGESKGCKVKENYPLVDTALWKLKSLLQSIGMKADGRVQIDLDKMEGKTLEIEVYYEEYNGQDRAKISETKKLNKSSEDDDEEDVEESIKEEEEEEEETKEKSPKKGKGKGKKKEKKEEKKEEPEEDSDDDWDDDDWDDDWDDED